MTLILAFLSLKKVNRLGATTTQNVKYHNFPRTSVFSYNKLILNNVMYKIMDDGYELARSYPSHIQLIDRYIIAPITRAGRQLTRFSTGWVPSIFVSCGLKFE